MLGEGTADQYIYAATLYWAGLVHRVCGELAPAEDLFRRSLNLCTERGFPYLKAANTINMGLLSALSGQAQAGLEQIHQGVEFFPASATSQPDLWRYELALGYELAGKPDEALAYIDTSP
jgi:tetratricopeptide (TPR) repeat protein